MHEFYLTKLDPTKILYNYISNNRPLHINSYKPFLSSDAKNDNSLEEIARICDENTILNSELKKLFSDMKISPKLSVSEYLQIIFLGKWRYVGFRKMEDRHYFSTNTWTLSKDKEKLIGCLEVDIMYETKNRDSIRPELRGKADGPILIIAKKTFESDVKRLFEKYLKTE